MTSDAVTSAGRLVRRYLPAGDPRPMAGSGGDGVSDAAADSAGGVLAGRTLQHGLGALCIYRACRQHRQRRRDSPGRRGVEGRRCRSTANRAPRAVWCELRTGAGTRVPAGSKLLVPQLRHRLDHARGGLRRFSGLDGLDPSTAPRVGKDPSARFVALSSVHSRFGRNPDGRLRPGRMAALRSSWLSTRPCIGRLEGLSGGGKCASPSQEGRSAAARPVRRQTSPNTGSRPRLHRERLALAPHLHRRPSAR